MLAVRQIARISLVVKPSEGFLESGAPAPGNPYGPGSILCFDFKL
jgi:hypothetical protein